MQLIKMVYMTKKHDQSWPSLHMQTNHEIMYANFNNNLCYFSSLSSTNKQSA